jgi:hypothetical protein
MIRPLGFVVLVLASVSACGQFLAVEPFTLERDASSPAATDLVLVPSPIEGGSSVALEDARTDVDAAPAPYVFVPSAKTPSFEDVFSRPDAPSIGNGWVEKTAGAFDLFGGQVRHVALGNDYTNVVVTRPASELGFDNEISATFTYADVFDDPTLYVRAQPDVDQSDRLTAYFLQVRTVDLSVGRQTYTATTSASSPLAGPEASITLLPSLVVGRSYRMVVRVTGKDPVMLEGALVSSDGVIIRSTRGTDSSSLRLTLPGRVGFSSHQGAGARWDDFRRIDL